LSLRKKGGKGRSIFKSDFWGKKRKHDADVFLFFIIGGERTTSPFAKKQKKKGEPPPSSLPLLHLHPKKKGRGG